MIKLSLFLFAFIFLQSCLYLIGKDKNNPTIEEFLQIGDSATIENLADQSLLPIIDKNGAIIEVNDNFNERNKNRLEKIAKHLERKKRKKNNNNDEQSVN